MADRRQGLFVDAHRADGGGLGRKEGAFVGSFDEGAVIGNAQAVAAKELIGS